jgi:hypothetical protein
MFQDSVVGAERRNSISRVTQRRAEFVSTVCVSSGIKVLVSNVRSKNDKLIRNYENLLIYSYVLRTSVKWYNRLPVDVNSGKWRYSM